MDVIDVAQRLIQVPSPVHDGNELAVVALLQDLLADLDLPSGEVLAAHPDRPNLVVTIDFGPGGRHLALCGHTDTKPVGAARWSIDPYAATVEGDRLTGLGSADMKGAIAAMLIAAARLSRWGRLRAGRLSLVLTADEEDGALFGARHLAGQAGLRPDALVIGEPGGMESDFDQLHVASRGLGRFAVSARARQGHSSLSSSHELRNAGVDLARAITALADGPTPSHPRDDRLLGWQVTLNPGMTFAGGYGYGVLPEQMATSLEVRTLPGMDPDTALQDVRAVVTDTASRTGADYDVQFDGEPSWLPGTRTDTEDPVVVAARRATHHVLGHTPPLSVFPGTTDASWFALQRPDLPCLPALGPGLLSRAHGADEWVSVDAVRRSVDIYELLALEYLSAEPLNEVRR